MVAVVAVASVLPAFAGVAEIDSLNNLGAHFIFSNIDEAIEIYSDAADEARRLAYPEGEAHALQSLGIALYLDGDHEAAAEAMLDAIRLFELVGDRSELAVTWGELGHFIKRSDLPTATEYIRKGIYIAEAERDTFVLCGLYDKMGVVSEMAGRADSAGYYYDLALDYKVALNDSLGIPYTLNNLGGIALMRGDFEAAARYLERSDDYRSALDDRYGLFMNAVVWGDIERKRGELQAAADHYERALAMPVAAGHAYTRQYCHENLAAIYEEVERYADAYTHHKFYAAVRDSLSNAETVSRVAELQVQYETEQKDRMLAEQSLAVTQRTRQVIILGATLIIAALLGGGFARQQAMKRKQLRRQLELEEQVRQAAIDRQLAEEKLRISRDLHDNIGSQITFLASSLDNLTHNPSAQSIRDDLNTLGDFGRQALTELRQTVWAMSAHESDVDGLVDRLHDLKRRCQMAGRELKIKSNGSSHASGRLSSARLLSLLRVAQEAVQNSLKHTEQGAIKLALDVEADRVIMRVADEGPGFVVGEVRHVGGLSTMERRCTEAGGTFSVRSESTGTEVVCTLPFE